MTKNEQRETCGSHTLREVGNDAECKVCGYTIKNYAILEQQLGTKEYERFYRRLDKSLAGIGEE